MCGSIDCDDETNVPQDWIPMVANLTSSAQDWARFAYSGDLGPAPTTGPSKKAVMDIDKALERAQDYSVTQN